MCDVLENSDDESIIERTREQVLALCARFPVYRQ
jgi:glycine hydroxymethyltransferase